MDSSDKDKIKEIERKIIHITDFMKSCEMYVNYWIAQATTGCALNRNIQKVKIKGGDYEELSDEEKTKDALNVAYNHIVNYREAMDNKIGLLNDLHELQKG